MKFNATTLILVLCWSSVGSFAQENTCREYVDIFPIGSLAEFGTEFFSSESFEQSNNERRLYSQIRGHENPFVSLMASYKLIDTNNLAGALYNLDFAAYLFNRADLCRNTLFNEFSMAAKIEIVSQLSPEVGTDYQRYSFPLLKDNSHTGLLKYEEYRCAIEMLDGEFVNLDFGRCENE